LLCFQLQPAPLQLGSELGEDTWAAIDTAVARMCWGMAAKELAIPMWAYATLGHEPSAGARAALEVGRCRWTPPGFRS